jgi:NAD(P)-dependent dehydrogenase (short-subunit alcohol dehydrogenase family)
LLIELLHVLGFACPLQAGAVTGASSIECAGVMAGLVPFRLERGQTTTNPTLRHHRAALVTGAGVRLGRAIADSLARAGYDIALHYNGSHAAATEAANEFRSYGVRCELFRYDLANAHDIGDLVARVAERLPHLSVLVNSASAYQGGRIADTSVETLNQQWNINFRAPFFLMQQFHQRVEHGQIINIVDNKIAYNQFHYVAYLSAKKALAELTKMAALEFAPRIRVNAVAPGVVLPASDRGEAYLEWRKAAIPVDRLGAPNNICAAIAAILENDFINGQIIFVDGGEAMNLVGRNALEFGNVSRA